MEDSVVKIGPRLMQLLLDGFLYHDLSLSSFMMRIHLIFMQHFIILPVSTLCCSIRDLKVLYRSNFENERKFRVRDLK